MKEQSETVRDSKCSRRASDSEPVPFWTSQRFVMSVLVFAGLACHSVQRVNLSIAMVCMVRADNFTTVTSSHNSGGSAHVTNGSTTTMTVMMGEGDSTSQFKYALSPQVYQDLPSVDENLTDRNTSQKGWMSGNVPEDNSGRRRDTSDSRSSLLDVCDSLVVAETESGNGEFAWSKELQGLLLGAFFWGYLALQVPAGVLSERYGARVVIMFTMLPVAILNLVAPVCARASPWMLLADRILIGLCEGAMYSSVAALFGRWVPISERGRLVAIALSGCEVGNAIMFPLGGYVCSGLGWSAVFYFTGACGVVWCLVWWLCARDSPAECPRISAAEREYLARRVPHRESKTRKSIKIPWFSIVTSLPFHAILFTHCCCNYGFFMMMTQMPTYMKEVLKFDMKSNGVYSMLPYLSLLVFSTMGGVVADKLISMKILSCVWARKLTTSIGMFGPAVCMIVLTRFDCTQQVLAVVVLCLCLGLSGTIYCGFLVNHGDIAPQYAGTLFGITNCISGGMGIVSPYIVALVTKNKTQEEWQLAFIIAAVIYACGGIFFLVFGQAKVQKWATSTQLDVVDYVPEPESEKVLFGNPLRKGDGEQELMQRPSGV